DEGGEWLAVFGAVIDAAALLLAATETQRPTAPAARMFLPIGCRTVGSLERPMANLVKLSGNFLIASVIEALGEALALVSKRGIDCVQYVDILTNTLFGAPVYKTYGELIAEERYSPAGFKDELGYKDVSLALSTARELK